jgi:hypothetical protein
MATISIRCEDENVHDKVLFHLERLFVELKDEEDLQTDMNYDRTKHGGRIIKVTYANIEDETRVLRSSGSEL